jgi:PAS domain S-box-containing protein
MCPLFRDMLYVYKKHYKNALHINILPMNMNVNVTGLKEFNVTQLNTEIICKQLLRHSRHNAVFILDTAGIIMGISEGAQRSYGYTHKDVHGKYFDMLFTEESRKQQKPELELAKVLQYGTAADYNEFVHKDGRYIWTEGESLLITDVWGDSFIIKNVHSLDKEKEEQRNLQQQNEKLLRINNDLDTFVYTASHDLKNPVSNIESLVSIMQYELKHGADAQAVEPVMSRITEALNRFKTTLNELTEISRIDAPVDTDEMYVSFDSILQEVMYDVQDLVDSTEASIQSDFSAATMVRFSKKNVRSILFNLLSNALKYRSPERKPEIYIETKPAGEYISLSVRDNGIGIEPAQHKKVFQFFKRLHTHVQGTGVGMGIVKKIMDNTGGKITLESIPGKGSTFTVHFKQ